MPVFGLNSGYEEVSGIGGLIEEGAVLFFTARTKGSGVKRLLGIFFSNLGLLRKSMSLGT